MLKRKFNTVTKMEYNVIYKRNINPLKSEIYTVTITVGAIVCLFPFSSGFCYLQPKCQTCHVFVFFRNHKWGTVMLLVSEEQINWMIRWEVLNSTEPYECINQHYRLTYFSVSGQMLFWLCKLLCKEV